MTNPCLYCAQLWDSGNTCTMVRDLKLWVDQQTFVAHTILTNED